VDHPDVEHAAETAKVARSCSLTARLQARKPTFSLSGGFLFRSSFISHVFVLGPTPFIAIAIAIFILIFLL
jgi:hypothetical protein